MISCDLKYELAEMRADLRGDFVNEINNLNLQLWRLDMGCTAIERAKILERIKRQRSLKYFERYPQHKYLYEQLSPMDKAMLDHQDLAIEHINCLRDDPEKNLEEIVRFIGLFLIVQGKGL